jgi:hypothetical protein
VANLPANGIAGRSLTIVARSLYRELHKAGYLPKDIVRVATELLELLAVDMRGARAERSDHE